MGYKIQKYVARTFGAEVHKSNIESKDRTTSMKYLILEIQDFSLKDFLIKSNRTALQKGEERTFGTPR